MPMGKTNGLVHERKEMNILMNAVVVYGENTLKMKKKESALVQAAQ